MAPAGLHAAFCCTLPRRGDVRRHQALPHVHLLMFVLSPQRCQQSAFMPSLAVSSVCLEEAERACGVLFQVEREVLTQYESELLEKEHSGCAALLNDDKVRSFRA